MLPRKKPPPPLNLTLARGSAHVALVRGAVEFILHDPQALIFREWVNTTYAPEETFFSTLNLNPQLKMPGAYNGK